MITSNQRVNDTTNNNNNNNNNNNSIENTINYKITVHNI